MFRSTSILKIPFNNLFKRANHIVKWNAPLNGYKGKTIYGCPTDNGIIYLKKKKETNYSIQYQVVQERFNKCQVEEITEQIDPKKILPDLDKDFWISKLINQEDISKLYLILKRDGEDFPRFLSDLLYLNTLLIIQKYTNP